MHNTNTVPTAIILLSLTLNMFHTGHRVNKLS